MNKRRSLTLEELRADRGGGQLHGIRVAKNMR